MRMLAVFALLLLAVSPVFADLRANATISPRYVDTSVPGQSFVYTIDVALNESISRAIINAPGGYQINNIMDITLNGTSCLTQSCVNRTFNSSQISINFSSVVNSTTNTPINVTFLANTSSSAIIGNFTSIINNSVNENPTNITNVTVTTQPIINVTNVVMTKGTALLNGTDYWEFKFFVAFTASQAGLIQFRMGNWTDVGGNILSLTNSTGGSHASLRNDSANFSTLGKFSVTNSYADNVGINRSSMPADSFLHLRMIIPASAATSNTWSSTYNFLFRATP